MRQPTGIDYRTDLIAQSSWVLIVRNAGRTHIRRRAVVPYAKIRPITRFHSEFERRQPSRQHKKHGNDAETRPQLHKHRRKPKWPTPLTSQRKFSLKSALLTIEIVSNPPPTPSCPCPTPRPSPFDFGRTVVRVHLAEGLEGRHGRAGALCVGIVDHDVSERLRRVEALVPGNGGTQQRVSRTSQPKRLAGSSYRTKKAFCCWGQSG